MNATNSQSKYEQEFLLCKLTSQFYKFTWKTKMQENIKDYYPKYTTSIYNEHKWQYRQKAISGGNIDYPENKELAQPHQESWKHNLEEEYFSSTNWQR